ncbi:MAG: hypothetical protein L0H96_07045 [Humibacillus sp.]|nr:hypothetical protein [Humibacillus sp.]MDN5776650.1 hypothetical protein [Humibacillus sp.]
MPEPAADGNSIEQRVARAVGDVSGVVRLEPSLARAVRRLAQRAASPDASPEDAPDGVTVTRREELLDVVVEISVTGPGTALETAVAVREVVLGELSVASLRPGAVSVRVLAVETIDAGPGESVLTASENDREGRPERKQGAEPATLPAGDDVTRPAEPDGHPGGQERES